MLSRGPPPPPTLHLHLHAHNMYPQQLQHRLPAAQDDDMFRQMCHSLLQSDAVAGALSSSSPSDESAGMLGMFGIPGAHEGWSIPLPSTTPTTGNKQSPPLLTTHSSRTASPMVKKQPREDAASTMGSQRQMKQNVINAEERLRGLTELHSEAEAENQRLKRLSKNLHACLKAAEFQQRMSEMVHHAPGPPLPLPASCSQVCYSEVPPTSRWDAAWISRIKRLSPQDFLVLRRQWTQASAVLFPQALAYGPGSDAYRQLEELHSRHMDLSRAMVMLSPSVWLESSQYDMDTLQPIKAPTAEWFRDLFKRVGRPDAVGSLAAVGREYHASTAALHAEYLSLLQRYNALARAGNLQPLDLSMDAGDGDMAGLGDAGPLFGFKARGCHQSVLSRHRLWTVDCHPQQVEVMGQLDQVAKLLQANTSKHKAALLKYFSICHQEFHPNRINFVLMTYPLAATVVDYIPGLLLLSAASTCISPSTPPSAGGLQLDK